MKDMRASMGGKSFFFRPEREMKMPFDDSSQKIGSLAPVLAGLFRRRGRVLVLATVLLICWLEQRHAFSQEAKAEIKLMVKAQG